MEIGETVVFDDPENHCFGCSPHNSHGLKLEFTRTAEHIVEIQYTVAEHLCGPANVVHGGIQATLLDEALGFACRTAFDAEEEFKVVTADFSLSYKRPVPTDEPLIVRGEVVRREGRNVFLKGAILNQSGEELTLAEARWVRIG